MQLNAEIKRILADHFVRGGNLRVFVNGTFQEISTINFDGCGDVTVFLEEPLKEPPTFEETLAAHCHHNHPGQHCLSAAHNPSGD